MSSASLALFYLIHCPTVPFPQQMFRMIGYGENIGSGFPSILKVWKEERWAEPELTERQDLNEVHLMLKIEKDSISSDNKESSCKSSCKSYDNMESSSISSCKLSDKQRAILNYLRDNPAATRHDMAENIEGLSFASTKYQVAQLKKFGYLDRVGSDNSRTMSIVSAVSTQLT